MFLTHVSCHVSHSGLRHAKPMETSVSPCPTLRQFLQESHAHGRFHLCESGRQENQEHVCFSDHRYDLPAGTISRLRIFLAVESITDTFTSSVTNAITNAITDRRSGRLNSQRREQFDDERLRAESNQRLCRRHGDLDEQRHRRAHIDGGRGRLELRLGRSGCDLLENVLVRGHVPVSLHDPSGHGRNGQRPVGRCGNRDRAQSRSVLEDP